MPDPKIAAAMGPYMQTARQRFPDYPPGSGTTWDQMNIDPREAEMLAYAALDALGKLGMEVIPKRKPDAQGP